MFDPKNQFSEDEMGKILQAAQGRDAYGNANACMAYVLMDNDTEEILKQAAISMAPISLTPQGAVICLQFALTQKEELEGLKLTYQQYIKHLNESLHAGKTPAQNFCFLIYPMIFQARVEIELCAPIHLTEEHGRFTILFPSNAMAFEKDETLDLRRAILDAEQEYKQEAAQLDAQVDQLLQDEKELKTTEADQIVEGQIEENIQDALQADEKETELDTGRGRYVDEYAPTNEEEDWETKEPEAPADAVEEKRKRTTRRRRFF